MPSPDKSSKRALILVDLQEDFCEGGALAITGGRAVAARCSKLLAAETSRWDLIAATRDWHEAGNDNGGHLSAHPDFKDTWPAHCLQGTPGAAYAAELKLPEEVLEVFKGQGKPAYSGFQGTTVAGGLLGDILREEGIREVEVVGLAFDYCVAQTALDAARLGFKTTVLMPLTAAVGDPTAARATLATAGVFLERDLPQELADLLEACPSLNLPHPQALS